MLLLDSAQLVDPITGNFAIGIPVDAIQTLAVNETPYRADYGGFSGGLTTIETKPPSGQWHYDLMDFIMGIRGKAGHMVGIADWTPRLTFGGPLLKNKLNFSDFASPPTRQPVQISRGCSLWLKDSSAREFKKTCVFHQIHHLVL